jgi:hypothetical protein
VITPNSADTGTSHLFACWHFVDWNQEAKGCRT